MAAFIVISADDRLHYLVDGIEKCRPLNPDIFVGISTGKIVKNESGYAYRYTIYGETPQGDDVKSLDSLLANQLAAFRKKYMIPKDELVKIFYLENPLTEEDLDKSEAWLNEFDEVYRGGQGSDTSFCIFRVVFSYDHANPTDVARQLDVVALQRLFEQHRNAVSWDKRGASERYFDRYLFYVDNQNSDAAALCLGKEEHDLKMPRFLMDFMMLASNSSDSYKVIQDINVTTRCFSVGFAESMYYFPDVERYYQHADNRDLYGRFLKDEDTMDKDRSKKSMDIEIHPFGLRSREKRLGQYYEDVPFTEDIQQYPESSDYKINECLKSLRELIVQERAKENEEFCNSPEVLALKQSIGYIGRAIEESVIDDKTNESQEEFEIRVEKLRREKESKEKELNDLMASFEPECPAYIDRKEIYTELCVVVDEADKEGFINDYSKQYNSLIGFVRSKTFLDFIEEGAASSSTSVDVLKNSKEKESESGCLYRLFSWFGKKMVGSEKQTTDGTHGSDVGQAANNDSPSVISPRELIGDIAKELELKAEYVRFKSKLAAVESDYNKEKKYCEDFELTVHTNHYCPLIDLDKLRQEQSSTFLSRIDECISEWRDQRTPTKSSLVELTGKESVQYTQREFSYVDWEKPYSFVKDLSDEDRLMDICNHLERMASPLVNYNVTSEFKENKIKRRLYSDRPNFKNEIEDIRTRLYNGREIFAETSKHIASKIFMMQILPLDDAVLDNLVDLVGQGESDDELVSLDVSQQPNGLTSS